MSGEAGLSKRAESIWAKLDHGSDSGWLPLHVHMRDTVSVSLRLWDEWLSESTKMLLSRQIENEGGNNPRTLIAFLAASHDLGKASPAFQAKAYRASGKECVADRVVESGLEIRRDLKELNSVKHAIVSMKIMERNGVDRTVSVIVGGHHGSPPSENEIDDIRLMGFPFHTGFKSEAWIQVQDELFRYAVSVSGADLGWVLGLKLPAQAQVILNGILIMADWMASNEGAFPLIGTGCFDVMDYNDRARLGWNSFGFRGHEGSVYGRRRIPFAEAFGFDPRDFQRVAIEAAESMSAPGIMVIEAPTGEGKTEAALAISEVFASKFGQNGLYFALPTQATADNVFPRVESWVRRCSGEGSRMIFLAHGKSRFNQDFMDIARVGEWNVGEGRFSEDNLVVNEWMSGKKGLLSDIVVGTVDQILMAGLKKKHLQLRHLGLSGKVVIIDECHAYDEYMGSYLCKALSWLGSYGVPVIVMSATLPPKRRAEVIEAYTGRAPTASDIHETEGYPLLTCADGDGVRSYTALASGRRRTVRVESIRDGDVIPILKESLAGGGHAGVIVNTVGRAQRLYDDVSTAFPGDDVHLLHSAFLASDRAANERDAMAALSRSPEKHGRRTIVVGTQVLEQSLDIDFDVLVTDICPVDLLIQRIGRLHRHSNARPVGLESPRCYVIDTGDDSIEGGTEAVYGSYQILNTRVLVGPEIVVPDDVPGLVAKAYAPEGVEVPSELRERYAEAKMQKDESIKQKERRAQVYQIKEPKKVKNLVKWLDYSKGDSDIGAEETVRDTDGSVEAILVCRCGYGGYRMPCDSTGQLGETIPSEHVPDLKLAYKMAGCRITLPHRLIFKYGLENVIKSLSAVSSGETPRCWGESPWLSGEMFLPCDEEGRMSFMGVEMKYDSKRGLSFVE